MKKTMATLIVTAMLMLGLPAVANAATQTIWSKVVCTYSASGVGYGWIYTYSTVDYDWYEEVFLGRRDYTKLLRIDRAYQYDTYCRTWSA